MKNIIITTTFEKREDAEEIATLLINNKLVACCQISEVESLYRWKGKIEKTIEFRMGAKTIETRYKEVEETIRKKHSYDIPEIIASPIINGLPEYLSWINEETA